MSRPTPRAVADEIREDVAERTESGEFDPQREVAEEEEAAEFIRRGPN